MAGLPPPAASGGLDAKGVRASVFGSSVKFLLFFPFLAGFGGITPKAVA
jgi:hypothetical protein